MPSAAMRDAIDRAAHALIKTNGSSDGPVTGRRSPGRGARPLATEAHREGLVEDLQEHFGPEVDAASVVEIVEIARTDIPVAEANLHHPFAVPPIPRDTRKAGPGWSWAWLHSHAARK